MNHRSRWRLACLAGCCTALSCLQLLLPPSCSSSAGEQVTSLSTADRGRGPQQNAYAFYVTELHYLCAALVNLQRLRVLESSQDIDVVVLFPHIWAAAFASTQSDLSSRGLFRPQHQQDRNQKLPMFQGLNIRSFDLRGVITSLYELGAVLLPVELLTQQRAEETWAESLTKLRVFQLVQYRRVVYLDADAVVLRNLDHLFKLPPAAIVLPFAYWLDQQDHYSTHIMVIQPSQLLFEQLWALAQTSGLYDMDVINAYCAGLTRRAEGNCQELPAQYALLSGEFRRQDHLAYLGGAGATWNATWQLQQAMYVHFSEWPDLPKPWEQAHADMIASATPACPPFCAEKDAWFSIYELYLAGASTCMLA